MEPAYRLGSYANALYAIVAGHNFRYAKMFDFAKKLYDIEHALVLYASSFVVMPAAAIYEKERLKEFEEISKRCHIYLVGLTPRVFLEDVEQANQMALLKFRVGDDSVVVKSKLPDGSILVKEDQLFRVLGKNGEEYEMADADMAQAIKQEHSVHFDVLYIGQAYGKAGERAALDRLAKHETLQKISLQVGAPPDKQLTVLLLEVISANRMVTMFNPFAKDLSNGKERIEAGIDKLYGTTEKERVALYEASLIRYFQPRYNKDFKDSFPSTDLKVLKDCYDKDFSSLVAEINFDDLPWDLKSEQVPAAQYHIAKHSLHTAEERSMFFSQLPRSTPRE
jgi:hypothetical protein